MLRAHSESIRSRCSQHFAPSAARRLLGRTLKAFGRVAPSTSLPAQPGDYSCRKKHSLVPLGPRYRSQRFARVEADNSCSRISSRSGSAHDYFLATLRTLERRSYQTTCAGAVGPPADPSHGSTSVRRSTRDLQRSRDFTAGESKRRGPVCTVLSARTFGPPTLSGSGVPRSTTGSTSIARGSVAEAEDPKDQEGERRRRRHD